MLKTIPFYTEKMVDKLLSNICDDGMESNGIGSALVEVGKHDKFEDYYENRQRPNNFDYLSRYLRYLDVKQNSQKRGQESIPAEVKKMVNKLVRNMKERNETQFTEELCGSFAENVKVCGYDEFDYVIPIFEVPGDNVLKGHMVTFKEFKIPQTKPPKSLCKQKGFFKIFMDIRLMKELGLEACAGFEVNGKIELVASKVQELYINKIKNENKTKTEARGPAATLHYRMKDTNFPLTVDLTIAIRKKKPFPPEIEFQKDVGGIEFCYFVPAYDSWRVSFSHKETKIISDLQETEKQCLRSLKVRVKLRIREIRFKTHP